MIEENRNYENGRELKTASIEYEIKNIGNELAYNINM